MTDKMKFKGKSREIIPSSPLERGNRDVMLNLWREYLVELLELDPKSGRRQLLIHRIEHAGDFDRLYADWNDLQTPERAERWLALIRTAKAELQEVQDSCLRCGECCIKSSPTLMAGDMHLFQNDILQLDRNLYPAPGRKSTGSPRTGDVVTVEAERLELKEHSGTRHCLYYATDPNRCLIYEQRPEQCREQLCNLSESERPAATTGFLTREDIFGQHPELWDLIVAHEQHSPSSAWKVSSRT